MIRQFALAGVLLLSGCGSIVVEDGSRKTDPQAAARDRVALAAEYIRKGEDDKALGYLQLALKSDPDSAEAHNLMGVVLERDGSIAAADREFRKAIRLREDYSQAHNNYGSFLFRQQRYKDAMKQFEIAADDISYNRRGQAFESYGRSAWMLGDKEKAEQAFSRGLNFDANLPMATLYMGEIQLEQKNYEAARNLYKRYLQLTSDMPQSAQSLWLGIRLERRFGDKDALASYELALKRLYPESPEYKQYQMTLRTDK
ncbi:MAG: type pilus biosis/stability protein PilW [Moraxellaceae bacterium]|jgi:type IV pilus assembly protein PilF|nr:type pilus biosis/stability protein PilW [Moraxellaceae bacterium]